MKAGGSLRVTNRRRRLMLLAGSAVGSLALSIVSAPTTAFAADECGAVPAGGGTVTCAAGDYPSGISYDAGPDDLTLVVPIPSTIEGGVFAQGDGMISTKLGGVSVTTTGDNGTGVLASGGTGSTIAVGSVTTLGDNSSGVVGFSGTGPISITAGTVATSGDHSDGVQASTKSGHGAIHLQLGNITTQGDFSQGIEVGNGSGDVDLTVADVKTSGTGANGVLVTRSGSGTILIHAAEVATTGDGSAGIDLHSANGEILSYSGNVSTQGDNAIGVHSTSDSGTQLLIADSVTTAGYNSSGLVASTNSGEIHAYSFNVATEGDRSAGVALSSIDGNISFQSGQEIALGQIHTIGTSSAGVDLYSVNGDLLSLTQNVATEGNYSNGVHLASRNGSVEVHNGFDSSGGLITTEGNWSQGIGAYAGADVTVRSDTVITHGDHSYGIATGSAYGSIDIRSDLVKTYGTYSHGIHASADGGDIAITSGTVHTHGAFSYGIQAVGNTGGLDIHSDVVTTEGESSFGILAISRGGDIAVTSNSVITHGDSAYLGSIYDPGNTIFLHGPPSMGIAAINYGLGGTTTVNSRSIETFGDSAFGILAEAYGDVSVTSGSIVTHGNPFLEDTLGDTVGSATGIFALSEKGIVDIDSGSIVTYGANAGGIYAQSGFYYNAFSPEYYHAGVTIHADSVTTHGNFSTGMNVRGVGGDADVSFGSIETLGDISAGLIARSETTFNFYNLETHVGNTIIHGDNIVTHGDISSGAVGESSGGDVAITIGNVETSGNSSFGVILESTHTNNYLDGTIRRGTSSIDVGTVTTHGYGGTAISGRSQGDLRETAGTVSTEGDFSVGMYAGVGHVLNYFNFYGNIYGNGLSYGGDAFVDVDHLSTQGAFSTGIIATSDMGKVTVDAGSVATHGNFAEGIFAVARQFYDYANGITYSDGVSVNADQVTTYGAESTGIVAAAYAGDVTVTSGGVKVHGANSDGIYAQTLYSGNVGITVNGDVAADHGAGVVVSSAGSTAIHIASGEVTGAGAGIFVDSIDGTTIDNHGAVAAGNGLAIDIKGGASSITNAGMLFGRIDLTDQADAVTNASFWQAFGSTDFGLGNDVLTNSGTIRIGPGGSLPTTVTWLGLEHFNSSGTVDMQNGHSGDVFDLGGASFAGSGESELQIDVGVGNNLLTADRLIVGSASGSTTLLPIGPAVFGSVTVVDAAAAAPADTFVLPGGEVDSGFVALRLAYDPTTFNWALVGTPDRAAFETLKLSAAGQDFWRRSSSAWSAHMEESRDAPPPDGRGLAMWGQYHSGNQKAGLHQTFDAMGTTSREDMSTDDKWSGIQAGIEGRRGDLTLGVSGGYVDQTTRFTADNNRLKLSGANIGGYVGWNSGRFFAHALVGYSGFDAQVGIHSVPQLNKVSGHSWGVETQAGYRFGNALGFVEPSVGLSWARTRLDNLTSSGTGPAATVDYGNGDSLSALAGIRAGKVFQHGATAITPYLGIYATDELDRGNRIRFSLGTTDFTAHDRDSDLHGKAVFGISASAPHGLQAFVKGEADFGGVSGVNGRVGVSWRW